MFSVSGWGAEADPFHVEALTEGVLVVPGDRWWSGPGGLGSGPAGGDHPTVGVGEDEPAGDVGVAGDAEFALVVESVVVRAETDQIPGFGRAVIVPVDDVVDFEVLVAPTPGDTAATVAEYHDTAGAVGDDVLGATDGDRHTVGVEHR